jgi:penicillin-binding protein 2
MCAVRRVPGRNVVLSIDYNFQKYAENALKKHTTGGAMVIMDVTNGDILAMASNPGFDLNEFVPGIRQKRYEELTKDPHLPLFPRRSAASIRRPRRSRSSRRSARSTAAR